MGNSFSVWEQKIGSWLTREKRVSFLVSVIVGVLTHFILLTDGLMSQDGLCKSIRYYSEDFDLSIGRWGIRIFERLRANYTIVYLSAIVSILFVAFAGILLATILELQSMTAVILTGITLEVSPALVLTMLHEYVSDVYFLALLFSLFAVLSLTRCKNKLVSTILTLLFTVFSLSLYQSYLGIEAGLCVILTVLALLDSERKIRETMLSFLRYVLTILAGLLIYLVTVKLVQLATGVTAGAYGGLNELGVGTVLFSLPSSIANAYRAFFQYFFRDSYLYNTIWHRDIFFLLFFLCFAVLLVLLIVRRKIYRDLLRLVFVLILLFLFPAAVNLIALIVPSTEIYQLSSLQMMLVVPFFFAIAERADFGKRHLIQWGGVVMLLCVIATYFMSDIISYKGLKETYDQALYGAERILDRMEQTEGYDRTMPVAFAGWFNDENYPQDGSYFPYALGPLLTGRTTHGDYYPNTESIRRFYLQFFSEQLTMADPATFTEIISSPEFEEMGIFPAGDSVKIIRDTLTVKLMNDPWPPY